MNNTSSVTPSFSCTSSLERLHWDLSHTLGHLSLQSFLPTFFSERLVQDCFYRRQLFSGVSWPHCKVSSLVIFSDLASHLFLFPLSRICNIVRRSGHCEGVSWTGWRSHGPRNCPLFFGVLYKKGVVVQVYPWLFFWRQLSLHWFRVAMIFSLASVRWNLKSGVLGPEVDPSSLELFPDYLLPQSKIWMALVDSQDGPGSSFSYIFQCLVICNNSEITFI